METSHEARLLVKYPPVIDLINLISQQVRDGHKNFKISPKETNTCLDHAFADQNLWKEDQTLYKENIDDCYKNKELLFLNVLADDGAITWSNLDDSGFITAEVIVRDPKYIFTLETWVSQGCQVIEYGDFMLNCISGVGYCLDKYHQFTPHSGIYRLFKSFITNKNHSLRHTTIVSTHENKEESTYHADELKEAHKTSRLLVNEIKKAFVLSPHCGYFVANDEGYSLNPHPST